MKSIGRRLMIYFGLLVFIACIGVGMISYSSSSRVLENAAQNMLPSNAENCARFAGNNIDYLLQTLETIADQSAVQSLDWEQQQPVLQNEAARLGYTGLGYAGLDGQFKAAAGSNSINLADNSQFKQALQGESNLSIWEASGSSAVMMAVPVSDGQGNIQGALIAISDGGEIDRILDQITVGNKGFAFIVDNQGKVVVHPDQQMAAVDLTDSASLNEDMADFIEANLTSGQTVGSYTFNGEEYFGSMSRIPDTEWYVVINVPRHEIMGPLSELGKMILYITLAFLLLGLIMAYLAGKQIATPIRMVSEQYARMAAGDFGGSISIKWRRRNDEIGELARGFNQINRNLSRTISELSAGEQRFRMITENMVDLVALTDLEGYMQYISPSHEHIIGWKVRQMLGKNVFTAIHPDDVEAAKEAYNQIISSRVQGSFIYRVLKANGEYRWLETKGKPLLDGKGQVVAMVTASRDIHERKQTEERMIFMAEHDALTGLYNRSFFENQMRLLDMNLTVPVGLIICDLDGLKFINDTLGHQAGDDLLLASAEILVNSAPEDSIVARLGGDEFGVLLPKYDDNLSSIVADNLRNAIAEYNITHPDILSISMGYATRMTPHVSLPAIYKEADQHMYREKLLHNQSARSAVVDVVMTALEARDFITEGHTDRLQDVVTLIARRLGLPENRINDLTLFARFHDIGKVGVPDSILFKPGRLTPEEFEEMKKHSEIGYRIAQSSPELVHIADFILKHHEWWDGNGYPLGIAGEDIPLECRIVSVADAYDAMNSDRPYRKALATENIIKELTGGAGSQFDPIVIEIFLGILHEMEHNGLQN